MLKIKTYIKESTIHGIGLFAIEFIPKGTTVWVFEESDDLKVYITEWNKFMKITKDIIPEYVASLEQYSWRKGNYIYSCCDQARYINHSHNNNLDDVRNSRLIANRDIQPDEELTENYDVI